MKSLAFLHPWQIARITKSIVLTQGQCSSRFCRNPYEIIDFILYGISNWASEIWTRSNAILDIRKYNYRRLINCTHKHYCCTCPQSQYTSDMCHSAITLTAICYVHCTMIPKCFKYSIDITAEQDTLVHTFFIQRTIAPLHRLRKCSP